MVSVRLFGTFRLDTGVKGFDADVSSVKELYPILLEKALEINPKSTVSQKDIEACIVIVNGIQTNKKAQLKDGDEVMILSPVCGG